MNIIIYLLIATSFFFSLYKLFPLAGRQAWEALIPGYNLYVWLVVIEKPWWWLILLLFPGVNIIMIMIMSGALAIAFNKRSALELNFAFFLPFIFLPKVALESETTFAGQIDRTKHPKSTWEDWRNAILFAVVAASVIRTYVFEAYTIPTSSMEKSLLVGDYLFVDKISYGPKIPETPLSFPFVHHTMPFTTSVPSYLEWIKLPYFRIPGFTEIERNDVVVFNFPEGDTVILSNTAASFDAIARQNAYWHGKLPLIAQKQPIPSNDWLIERMKDRLLEKEAWTVRPTDKKDNYIKRCIAVPDDKIEVREGVLYINGNRAEEPEMSQYSHIVKTTEPLNPKRLKEKYDVSFHDYENGEINETMYDLPLSTEQIAALKEVPSVSSVTMNITESDTFSTFFEDNILNWCYSYTNGRVAPQAVEPTANALKNLVLRTLAERNEYHPSFPTYPNDSSIAWTEDNFGPLWVPKAGETIELTKENLILYGKVIRDYEKRNLVISGNQILIDGEPATSYTFNMDYYFMMGDNRHRSADSRFWGFVPEDHVVGKAAFVWLSLDPDFSLLDGKIRWERLFHLID